MLADGSGSQWSPDATEALLRPVDGGATKGLGAVLGQATPDPDDVGLVPDCVDALPDELRVALSSPTSPPRRVDRKDPSGSAG